MEEWQLNNRWLGIVSGLVVAASVITAAGAGSGPIRAAMVGPFDQDNAVIDPAPDPDAAASPDTTDQGWMDHVAKWCFGPFALRDSRVVFSGTSLFEDQTALHAKGQC